LTGQNPLDFDVSQSYLVTTNVSTSTETNIGPIAGSTSVPVSPTFMLYFDRGVTTDTVWSINQSCFTLQDSTGANIPITILRLAKDSSSPYVHDIFLTPVSNLTPGQTYTITISKNLTANNGKTLGGNDGNKDQTVTFTVAGGGGPGGTSSDTQAPTWPSASSLTAANLSKTGLTLTWSAASDNTAVAGYRIYQGSTLLGNVGNNTLTYSVTGLTAGTNYTFQVQAGDAAGNWSTNGPSTNAKTLAAPGGGTATEITTTHVTVATDGSNKGLGVTNNTPSGVTITVPSSVTDATLDVSSLLNSPVSGTVTTSALPAMTITAATSLSATPVQVSLPAGMTVGAAAGWNGTINIPTVIANNSVTVTPDSGQTAAVNAVIEVGYGDVPLTLSAPVRILLPGQAGKDVGYIRGGVFTKISNHLTQDSGDSLAAGGDGYINVGSDLVIWTRHFTEFVAYTQTQTVTTGSTAPSLITYQDTKGNYVSVNYLLALSNAAMKTALTKALSTAEGANSPIFVTEDNKGVINYTAALDKNETYAQALTDPAVNQATAPPATYQMNADGSVTPVGSVETSTNPMSITYQNAAGDYVSVNYLQALANAPMKTALAKALSAAELANSPIFVTEDNGKVMNYTAAIDKGETYAQALTDSAVNQATAPPATYQMNVDGSVTIG